MTNAPGTLALFERLCFCCDRFFPFKYFQTALAKGILYSLPFAYLAAKYDLWATLMFLMCVVFLCIIIFQRDLNA